MKVIGIFGISYCGSTLLSHICGKSRNCFNVGESHWLFDDRCYRNSDNKIYCGIHGKDCEFWTDAFFEEVGNANSLNIVYDRASEMYGVDFLILSDKNVIFYDKLRTVCKTRVDKSLVLIKRPEQFVSSVLRKTLETCNRLKLIESSLNAYVKNYSLIVNYLVNNKISNVLIRYDDLVLDPNAVMNNICNAINIEYNDNMLDLGFVEPKTHVIAGSQILNNSIAGKETKCEFLDSSCNKTKNWYKEIGSKIVNDCKWQFELSDDEKFFIKNQGDAVRMYESIGRALA